MRRRGEKTSALMAGRAAWRDVGGRGTYCDMRVRWRRFVSGVSAIGAIFGGVVRAGCASRLGSWFVVVAQQKKLEIVGGSEVETPTLGGCGSSYTGPRCEARHYFMYV